VSTGQLGAGYANAVGPPGIDALASQGCIVVSGTKLYNVNVSLPDTLITRTLID
jgi:hypothetical protein